MNALDQLELDILAMTGDVDTAETAGLMAMSLMDELLDVGFYMLGFSPEIQLRIMNWK